MRAENNVRKRMLMDGKFSGVVRWIEVVQTECVSTNHSCLADAWLALSLNAIHSRDIPNSEPVLQPGDNSDVDTAIA